MIRKLAFVLALGTALVAPSLAGAPDMAAMKAEMSKCMICKTLAPHIDELFPVMSMEVIHLNDGVAIAHHVSDPAKLATYRSVHDEMIKACDASMTLTDEQAKTQLCPYCNDVRSAMKGGASSHMGNTQDGDIMAFTSSDPAIRAKLAVMAKNCEMMMASMKNPSSQG